MIQKDLKLNKPVEVKNSIGMELILIPAGEFTMGLDQSEVNSAGGMASRDGVLPRNVKIRTDFYLGKYEVTQGQWKLLMGKNPSVFPACGDDCPVENISWNQAQAFIKKLNEKNDGYRYRLPSEAEWELAARGKEQNKFPWGNEWNKSAAISKETGGKISEVKSFEVNRSPFGAYDMAGNVWELTENKVTNEDAVTDPALAKLLKSGQTLRVVKGGTANDPAKQISALARFEMPETVKHPHIGFRYVITP